MNYYFDFPESPFEIQKLRLELKNILPLRQDLLTEAASHLKEIEERPHTKAEWHKANENRENYLNECVSIHRRINRCEEMLSKICGKFKH